MDEGEIIPKGSLKLEETHSESMYMNRIVIDGKEVS
jgi:hypothetical protein